MATNPNQRYEMQSVLLTENNAKIEKKKLFQKFANFIRNCRTIASTRLRKTLLTLITIYSLKLCEKLSWTQLLQHMRMKLQTPSQSLTRSTQYTMVGKIKNLTKVSYFMSKYQNASDLKEAIRWATRNLIQAAFLLWLTLELEQLLQAQPCSDHSDQLSKICSLTSVVCTEEIILVWKY